MTLIDRYQQWPGWLKGGCLGLMLCIALVGISQAVDLWYHFGVICPGDRSCYLAPWAENMKLFHNHYLEPIAFFPSETIMDVPSGQYIPELLLLLLLVGVLIQSIFYFICGSIFGHFWLKKRQ